MSCDNGHGAGIVLACFLAVTWPFVLAFGLDWYLWFKGLLHR